MYRAALARFARVNPGSLIGRAGYGKAGSGVVGEVAAFQDPVIVAIAGAGTGWLSLFLQAHFVVKMVMMGLCGVSVWSWAVIIERQGFIRQAQTLSRKFEREFWSGQSLDDLYRTCGQGPIQGASALFVAAMREWGRSCKDAERPLLARLELRIEKVLHVALMREVERCEKNLTVLATIASVAPFVGLFGTVWGVMDSFRAIAASGNASLAVVAPGIAEALFATALGLFAAIPAVVFYNKLSGDLASYTARLESFSDEFLAILSRHVDEKD